MKPLASILAFLITCAAAAERLDINRLYSLPWVIGTAPKGFIWSADSRAVAFLWNDEGTNFRDVWIATREKAQPVRVTRMPRPQVPSNTGNDLQTMQRAADAEMDPGVTEVLWSPDQARLIFLFKGQLWSVPPRAGGEPQPLTSKTNIGSVAIAAAGNKIAFQSGGELFIASVNPTGPATELNRAGSGPRTVEDMVWSHAGRVLAFTETDDAQVPRRGIPDYLGPEAALRMVKRAFPGEPSERRRVGFVIAGEEGRIQWASLGGDPLDIVFHLAWSPDDKTLLVDKSDLYIKDRRLLLVDPRSGNSSALLRETDPQNVTGEWWSDWAPDGRGVYFTSDRENFYQVYYAPLSGSIRRVTSGRAEVFWASLNVRANALFYISNEGRPEERHLHKVSLADGGETQITHAAGTHAVAVSPDGSIAADDFSSDLIPPDLYFQRIDSLQSSRQVTYSPRPVFERYRWSAARYVTFPAADGVTLHGRLTLPPDFDPKKRYPAILGSVYSNTVRNQWGGRVAHPTWGLDQYLVQQGYILLNVDIRGSLGYGKAFRQRLALDYGGIDVEDLSSGVKFLGTLGYVDMARVGIWGSSYGGLLTTTSLFTKPGLYKAGVAGAPATSLFHALTGEMQTMMAPQHHPKEYANASAFLKSAGLTDHLMIIHGMRDEIVLFQDSVALEQRLILQGKDVQMVVLPNAPHSWDTGPMVQTRFAFNQLIAFFGRFLGEGPSREQVIR